MSCSKSSHYCVILYIYTFIHIYDNYVIYTLYPYILIPCVFIFVAVFTDIIYCINIINIYNVYTILYYVIYTLEHYILSYFVYSYCWIQSNHFSNQDRVSFVISLHPGFPYPWGRHQWIQKPMEVRTWDTWDNVKPIPVHGCQAVDWFCCPSCINSTSNSIHYIMVACSSKKNFWSLVGTPKPTRENSFFFLDCTWCPKFEGANWDPDRIEMARLGWICHCYCTTHRINSCTKNMGPWECTIIIYCNLL